VRHALPKITEPTLAGLSTAASSLRQVVVDGRPVVARVLHFLARLFPDAGLIADASIDGLIRLRGVHEDHGCLVRQSANDTYIVLGPLPWVGRGKGAGTATIQLSFVTFEGGVGTVRAAVVLDVATRRRYLWSQTVEGVYVSDKSDVAHLLPPLPTEPGTHPQAVLPGAHGTYGNLLAGLDALSASYQHQPELAVAAGALWSGAATWLVLPPEHTVAPWLGAFAGISLARGLAACRIEPDGTVRKVKPVVLEHPYTQKHPVVWARPGDLARLMASSSAAA
jgi:hypothetical protein